MPDLRPDASLLRRFGATTIDALVLLVVPILFWHWSEWARYTNTFGRQLPSTIAIPIMALMPLTVLWLEAATGRSAGKAIFRLRVVNAAGRKLPFGRSLLRSAIKWSPAWVGAGVWIFDAFTRGARADDFTNDYLAANTLALAEHLPRAGQKIIWAANVSLKGMNWGVIPLLVLAAGYLLVSLPSRRTLLDRIAGTQVHQNAS